MPTDPPGGALSSRFVETMLADPEQLTRRFQAEFTTEAAAKLLYAMSLIRGEIGMGEIRITMIDGKIKDINLNLYLKR